MPKKLLPPGWPDPYTLLRDINWEMNYPKILLRGIYDIMQRAPGKLEAKYVAGFNICLTKLTLVSQPPVFWKDQILDGILTMETLTPYGKRREKEVLGKADLSPKSRQKYGKKTTRSDMAKGTRVKLKKLRRLLETVVAITSEPGMPPGGGVL